MEEQKIDKRTKEYKKQTGTTYKVDVHDNTSTLREIYSTTHSDLIEELKGHAIKMKKVILQDVVESCTGDPERCFYDSLEKNRKSRTGRIWYTPHIVLIEQDKNHKIILPTTMVKYAIPF